MQANDRPDLSRVVDWARKGIAPWRKPRKLAVKLWRAGNPVAWIAATMNVTRQWVHKWIHRYVEGGKHWAALDDRSSRPRTIHAKRFAHVDDILELKNKHPHLGAAKLRSLGAIQLSHGTVHRVLSEHGLVKLAKKKWRKYKRFQRPTINYLWQLDITQVALEDGPWNFIATLLDDCSRYVLASKTYEKELTTADVTALIRDAIRMWGRPRQILTDRGCQFHTESDDPSLFTLFLDGLGIQHIRARPRHPRTLGKIERWHRSLKEEWFSHHDQPKTRAQLQGLLNAWVEHYNNDRPHCALKYRVPMDAYLGGFMLADDIHRAVNEVA